MHIPFMQQDDIIRALGWTFVHSLWQGMLLAVLAGLVVLLTRKSGASLRYNLMVGLFCLFLAAAGFTFISELQKGAVIHSSQAVAATPAYDKLLADDHLLSPVMDAGVQDTNQRFKDRFVAYFNTHAPMIVLIWFIIFSARLVKLLANLGYVQRIRHYKTHTPSERWTKRMRQMAEGLLIRQKLQLLESAIVNVPVVVGFFKPVILIPLGLLAQLPSDQVEAILLHELAHIKRKDYFVNLLQSFAETIFFFNPAVLWLSSLIREERENCCDDIAVAGTGNKTAFLDALVSFQEYTNNAAGYSMAFPGRKNHLLNRVKRILHQKNKTLNTMEKSLLTFSIALILLLTLTTARQAQGQTDTGVIAGKVLPPPPPPPVPPVARQVGPAPAIAPLPPPRPAIAGSRVPEPATPAPAAIAAPVPAPPVAAAPALPQVSADVLAPAPSPKPALTSVDIIGYPSPAVPPVPPVVLADTIQPRENQFPHLSCSISDDGTTKTESIDATDRDGKKYKLNRINDVITFLSVDGVEVPKEKYGDYEDLVRQLEQQRSDNRRRAEQQHIKALKLKTEALQLRQQHDIEAKKWVMAKEMKDRNVVVLGKPIKDLQLQKELTRVYIQKLDDNKIEVQTKKGYAVKYFSAPTGHEVRKVIGHPVYKTELVVVGKKIRPVDDGAGIQEQKDLARALINELVKDHIINDAGSIVWFGITNDQFIVNGAKQPTETLEKYKAKYLTHPGMGLFYGPVKMSGTGYFIDKDDL